MNNERYLKNFRPASVCSIIIFFVFVVGEYKITLYLRETPLMGAFISIKSRCVWVCALHDPDLYAKFKNGKKRHDPLRICNKSLPPELLLVARRVYFGI